MDWTALIATLQAVQGQNADTPLEMQAIENKGDSVFVVKVHVPPRPHQEFSRHHSSQNITVEDFFLTLPNPFSSRGRGLSHPLRL